VIGALLAGMLFGFLTERIVIRPLFEAPRVTLLVATAGVALLAIAIQQWLFDNQGRPIARAFPRTDRVSVFGVDISDQKLWLIATLAVLAVLLGLFFTRTNLGLAIIGASQEPTATELVGISVRRLSTFTWVLAALLGGLAAVIAVPDTGQFTPGIMTSAYLIPAFTAAVLGGMTSLPGAFLGGVLVGIIQSVASSAEIFQDIPGTPSTLIVFLVLLGVLIVRPQGLLGKAA
jgi:branched-chain amino acid transport system permease protein